MSAWKFKPRSGGAMGALKEVPLLVGLGVGWARLLVEGEALLLDGRIGGYRWMDYLRSAWALVEGEGRLVDPFRQPLHGWLVGHIGDAWGSYPDAALLLAGLALMGMVLATGLAGRLLGGPWVGGVAAASLPWTASTLDAARWGNNYPLGAFACAAVIVLALALPRWPRPGLSLAAGLALGLALAADSRALLWAPILLVCLGHAAWRARSHRTRVLLVLALGIGTMLGPGADRVLGPDAKFSHSWSEIRNIQRDVVVRWQRGAQDEALNEACSGVPHWELLTIGFLSTPCARATLAGNLRNILPRHVPFGLPLTVLGFFALLLPVRDRFTWIQGICAAGGCGGALLLMGAWAPFPDRYVLVFAVPLALVPVAGASVALSRLPKARVLQPMVLVALFLVALVLDPADRNAPTPLQKNPDQSHLWVAAAVVPEHLDDGDRFFDESGLSVEVALLPRRTHDCAPSLRPFETPRPSARRAWSVPDSCREKGMTTPLADEGRVWVLRRLADPTGAEHGRSPAWTGNDVALWEETP